MKKRFLSILLAVAMAFSLVPTMGITASAGSGGASYLYPEYNTADDPTSGIKQWHSQELPAENYKEITNATTSLNLDDSENDGWYVVTGNNVQISGTVTASGNVKLLLCDDAKLTITGEYYCAGLMVSGANNSLTIYGQADGTGVLDATGGGEGAGIGGGQEGAGSNITINGGTVKATAGSYSAGIGGGKSGTGSNITINGGTVTAIGNGNGGAGIGGGNSGTGSNITINGGTVAATGNGGGAGIGGGEEGAGSNITVNGGTVTANGSSNAGIGAGIAGSASDIYVDTALVIQADNDNPPTTVIDNTGSDLAETFSSTRYIKITPPPAVMITVSSNTDLNNTEYATIAEALAAAGTNATTIQLRRDVTENVTISGDYNNDGNTTTSDVQNITLDLNGKVLAVGFCQGERFSLTSGQKIIRDSP